MNAVVTPVVPKRVRPFEKNLKPTPTWLRLLLGRDLAPSRAEYDAVVAALSEGDKAMDAVIDWMYSIGPGPARKQFMQAMEHGIDSVPDAAPALRAFFAEVDTIPAWLDWQLLEEGQRFIHGTGLTSTYVLRDLALMGGYMLSGFNQALVKTGALNRSTARRVAETGKWWIDCTTPGALQRQGAGFRSTLHVRLVHGLVRRNLLHGKDWDTSEWGVPLSQIDMVATYLGFSVVMLGGLRKLGIPVTPRESQAVMHLWRYACWLMGVDTRWLVDDERSGVVLLNHTFMTQSRPDWTSRELAVALSREPLERNYPVLQDLRRQLAYRQHLSVSRYFLGPKKMRLLGLPDDIGPWYPLLTLPGRFLSYSSKRLLPQTRRQLQEEGRAAQLQALAQLFGDSTPELIRPDANHPAHT